MSESKRSLFEWFTQLAVPLVATIAAFFQQKQRMVALGLIALAVISLLVSGIPKLRTWLKQRKLRKSEERISAGALDELKDWIHKFFEFSNTQNSDTLYAIIFSRLCQSNGARFELLHLGPPQLFADFTRILATRTDERRPRLEVLKQSVSEFNSIVGLYSSYVVCPVYEKIPLKLSPETLNIYNTSNLERDLIQFRERYDRFLDNYMDFLKTLDRKLPHPIEPTPFGYCFERPKPLISVKTQATV